MDAEPGVDPHRVAEIIVRGRDGGRRGSGYRVASGLVLTAAHVVADPASDLAVVLIDTPDAVPACAFGRIGDHPDDTVRGCTQAPRRDSSPSPPSGSS